MSIQPVIICPSNGEAPTSIDRAGTRADSTNNRAELVVSFRWPRTSIFVQCAEHEQFGKVLRRREEKVNTSRRLYHLVGGIQYPIAGAQVTLVPPVIARRGAVPGLDPGKQSPAGRAEERSSGGDCFPGSSPGTAPRLTRNKVLPLPLREGVGGRGACASDPSPQPPPSRGGGGPSRYDLASFIQGGSARRPVRTRNDNTTNKCTVSRFTDSGYRQAFDGWRAKPVIDNVSYPGSPTKLPMPPGSAARMCNEETHEKLRNQEPRTPHGW